jgi:hypothetical protein
MPPVFHDNHLMRFVPLLPSELAPQPWLPFPAVELAWTGVLHPGWKQRGPGPEVHAIHLPATAWTEALGESALAALAPGLGIDFLVLLAPAPGGRLDSSQFLRILEGLLEVTQGRGVKLALRPEPGAAPALVKLLRSVRGEAVGFCWDPALGADLDCISDRLFCAVLEPDSDCRGLQHLGYRWNGAVPSTDPDRFRNHRDRLVEAWPEVLFPAELPPVQP